MAQRRCSTIGISYLGKIWLNADEGGARYDNLGAEQRSLLLNTIGPYLDTIAAELSLKLMAPCKFKQMDLSRLDPATRFEIYVKATAMGILTPEEIKQAEGF